MEKKSYKDALIDVIMSCGNNPYEDRKLLESLRLMKVQEIHDSLMLSRGKPIEKLSSQELMLYQEIKWH